MTIEIIGPEAESPLSWDGLVQALEAGHRLPRAEIADIFLYRGRGHAAEPRGLDRRAGRAGQGRRRSFPATPRSGKPTVNGAVNAV